VGASLHRHYFWGNSVRLSPYANFGNALSLVSPIGSFGFVLWSVIMG
jgi:hypothetical protein